MFSDSCYLRLSESIGFCSAVYSSSFFSSSSVERKGRDARCFPVKKNGGATRTGACLKYQCTASGLNVIAGQTTYNCTEKEKTYEIGEGMVLTCPGLEFCEKIAAESCPGDCSGNGICRTDKTCQCRFGFAGSSCEKAMTVCPV